MASKSLGTLTIDLVAKTAGFTAGLSKAERESAKWKKSVSSNLSSAASAAGTAIASAAAVAAGGVALIVNKQRELIDQQLITAQSLNTTYASMSSLERAGDLAGVGMDVITKASGKLALNIGAAIQGSKAQVEAFDRLGLSAQAVYELPLDERIAAINTALKENVQESERAAVAADIFGAKNAVAMQLLDGDTIAEATHQAELFGLALSDVDASKVEAANDSISVISLGLEGAAKQLTVAFAPAIDAAGKMFLQAAEDAGGLGNVVADTVDTSITALSFLMNAADGVGRAFKLAADIAILQVAAITEKVTGDVAVLLALVDKVPGVDMSESVASVQDFATTAKGVMQEAKDSIDQSINEPLAGDKFREFWDKAKVASQEAAEQAVKTREETAKTGEAFDDEAEARKKAADEAVKAAEKAQEAIQGELTALQKAADTWGMSADQVKIYDLQLKGANQTQLSQAQALLDTVSALEKQKEATENYQKVVEGLRTDEEKRTDNLMDQLDAIEAVNDASAGDTRGRAIDAAFKDAPANDKIGQAAAGPFKELFDVNEQGKKLEEWYATQMEMLNTFRSERSDLTAEWDAKELELKKQHEAAMQQLEVARWQATLSGVTDILGNISDTIDTDSKEGKEKSKKLAIAQATINAFTAATGAWASASAIPVIGWIMGPIAAAAALAAGMANVNKIKGQAHDGIMTVPSSGTWNLEKGERVTTANTSAKLDATLEKVNSNMARNSVSSGGGKSVTVNQTINTQGAVDNRTANQIAIASNRKQRVAQARFS